MRIGAFEVGNDEKLFLIAGPCVIESEALAMETAQALARIAERSGIGLVYKSSFDKANRTSHESFRGPGMEAGLRILERVRNDVSVPVITDVHEDTPIDEVASVVDVLQTPAFLCRQTNFIQAVARCGKPVNIKKGQFLAPWDMIHVADKARATGNPDIMLCERGASFGYNYLVSDMRSLVVMRETGCPVVFDATHSVQMPGGQGSRSGGQREFVPVLARAAVATGVAGVFMETHPNPDQALSDGPNVWPLGRMEELLECLLAIDEAVKSRSRAEDVRGSGKCSGAGADKERLRCRRSATLSPARSSTRAATRRWRPTSFSTAARWAGPRPRPEPPRDGARRWNCATPTRSGFTGVGYGAQLQMSRRGFGPRSAEWTRPINT